MPGCHPERTFVPRERLRHDFPGRSADQECRTHADHGAAGTWFGSQRKKQRSAGIFKWPNLAVVLTACTAIFLSAGCGAKQPQPQAVYDAAWLDIHRGDLTAALRIADEAARKFPDPQSEWHWRFWALKGEMLMLQGHYEEALTFLAPPLPPNLAASDVAVWQKLTQGAACARLGRFDEAASFLKGAESLAQSAHPELLDECALRRGTLYFHRGDTIAARDAYRAALQLARERKNEFLEVAALGSLAVASTRLEHYDEAIDWNGRALQLSQALGDLRSVSKIEGNSGWSYHEIGDYANALAQFENAEQDAERAGLVADRVYWLNSAAGVHYDLAEYSAAEATSQKAIALTRKLKDDGSTIECLQNLALVALARNQFEEAKHSVDEALQLENSRPDQVREQYTRLIAAHLKSKTGDLSGSEASFAQILADSNAPSSVRWEAQAGRAQVHATQGKAAQAEREFGESIATISRARNALQHEDYRLSFLSNAIRFYDGYVNFLIDQHRPLDALKIADLSRAQTLEEGWLSSTPEKALQAVAFNPQAIARRLNATLLFYWLGEQRSYLWAVTAAKTSVFTLPGSSEIEMAVKSYRQAFLEPRDPVEAGNPDGKKLYATLVQPAEKLIAKNSRVIVLPDGSLNSLNFETLIAAGPQPHYWIEDVTLLTANSLALLARSSVAAPPRDGRILLVGDALAANADFPALPQAGKEVGLLENYFSAAQRTELTGANATATRFLSSQPEKYSYLHFATHGTASRTRPLESAVILSPEGDSYKLYAREVVKHPLHAYLVTISACNGAGTKSYAGEGLVGLSWAFLRAGAHNVIAGLWEVSNASTPQLMDELYKGMHAGEDPATALRRAKLTLVHSTGNYRKPFYWAPFLVYAGG